MITLVGEHVMALQRQIWFVADDRNGIEDNGARAPGGIVASVHQQMNMIA
jgi:hypothetical protein